LGLLMKPDNHSVVFITGAGRGVGRAVALAFAQHGADVAAQDITPVNLEETLALVRAHGNEALELVGDMSKKMQAQGMIEQARAALGEIDILVNHWAVAPDAGLLAIDEWDWDRTLGINLKGYFLAIQSLGRVMSDRGQGTILNLVVPPTRFDQSKSFPAYEVSAAAVRELTRQAGQELAPWGVQILAVETKREISKGLPEDQAEFESTPAWWQLEPETFASAVVELCSRSEGFEPGQLVLVYKDGSIKPENPHDFGNHPVEE
jgi:NAD(P)-dependent dehydrogenase (short-subunit alcohol dehydrogenase family)